MLAWFLRQGWPRQLPILLSIGVLAPAAWMALASWAYCRLSGQMALFTFPYDQWFDAVPYWATSRGMTKFCIAVAALTASAPFVALIARVVIDYFGSGARRPSLYGQTGFAPVTEMVKGGLRLKDKF